MEATPARYGFVGRYRAVLWGSVLVITLVFGYGISPWPAIAEVLQDKGVSSDNAQLIAYAAGYCAPAVAATAVTLCLWAREIVTGKSGLLWTAVIFIAASWLSQALAFGLPADFAASTFTRIPSMPPVWRILAFTLAAYVNAYGIGLFLTALAIGSAIGLEILHRLEKLANG